MSPSRLVLALFVLFALSLLPSQALAQMPDSTVASQMPQPGSGHHYIGLGGETVNPADGSLSFHLPISLPSGRGLTMPFGIDYAYPYNSYVTHNAGLPAPPYWGPYLQQLTRNGWSLDEPYLLGLTAIFAKAYDQSTNITSTCLGSGSYVFRGFDQTTKPFDLPPGSAHGIIRHSNLLTF